MCIRDRNDSQIFEGDVSIGSNQAEIAKRSKAPVLTRIRYESSEIVDDIDWHGLAKAVPSNTNAGFHGIH